MLQEQITQDLKAALLSGDKLQTSVLRSIKSAIIYAEVAQGIKGVSSLSDQEILDILAKEAKKRQESATLYIKGGALDKADTELQEKTIIDRYLPVALSRNEVEKLVDKIVGELGEVSQQTMGQIIGRVKQESKGAADGAMVAQIVKERLGK